MKSRFLPPRPAIARPLLALDVLPPSVRRAQPLSVCPAADEAPEIVAVASDPAVAAAVVAQVAIAELSAGATTLVMDTSLDADIDWSVPAEHGLDSQAQKPVFASAVPQDRPTAKRDVDVARIAELTDELRPLLGDQARGLLERILDVQRESKVDLAGELDSRSVAVPAASFDVSHRTPATLPMPLAPQFDSVAPIMMPTDADDSLMQLALVSQRSRQRTVGVVLASLLAIPALVIGLIGADASATALDADMMSQAAALGVTSVKVASEAVRHATIKLEEQIIDGTTVDAKRGSLLVGVTNGQCQLLIDDEARPGMHWKMKLELAPGAHTVACIHSSGKAMARAVKIVAGKESVIVFKFGGAR